jgi:hypothetical protein
MHDRLERIESIKAAGLGGLAAGIGYGAIEYIDRLLLPAASQSLLSLGLAVAIAIASGFLFGIAYRYIIRTDRNAHLNSGAVLAFGLVRGLAQVDVERFQLAQIGINTLLVGKSILLFTIARYSLDFALSASWILPFDRSAKTNDADLHAELAARKVLERSIEP